MKYHSALVPRARADIGHTRIWKVAKRLMQPNRKGQRNLNLENMVNKSHLIAYSMACPKMMEKNIPRRRPPMIQDLQAWNRYLEQIWSRCRVIGQVLNRVPMILRCL